MLYLVLFEGVEKMVEVLVPDRAPLGGSCQFGEHRVIRVALVVSAFTRIEVTPECLSKCPETLHGEGASLRRWLDIVGEVVGAAAEGVHRGKIAHELLGEKR